LILRLRYYPAWRVEVNGVAVKAVAERERGLIAVPVPQGRVQVSAHWTATGDVVAARWVSGASLLLVTGLFFFERKSWRDYLSSWASSQESTKEPELPAAGQKNPASSIKTGRRNTPSPKPQKPVRRK
jgi:hypothetical protein